MNSLSLKEAMNHVSALMTENKDYLIELDAQNGDGDLGLSMSAGYAAVAKFLNETDETDLGKLMMKCGGILNEAAPSTLGTITSFGMMSMAKALKGKTEADLAETAEAMEQGIRTMMEKAGAKPGEKTILDSLCPAVASLKEHSGGDTLAAFEAAAKAAAVGSENTRQMRAVHGRAVYYEEKSIGILDGGSVVGRLIFEGIRNSRQET